MNEGDVVAIMFFFSDMTWHEWRHALLSVTYRWFLGTGFGFLFSRPIVGVIWCRNEERGGYGLRVSSPF